MKKAVAPGETTTLLIGDVGGPASADAVRVCTRAYTA